MTQRKIQESLVGIPNKNAARTEMSEENRSAASTATTRCDNDDSRNDAIDNTAPQWYPAAANRTINLPHCEEYQSRSEGHRMPLFKRLWARQDDEESSGDECEDSSGESLDRIAVSSYHRSGQDT